MRTIKFISSLALLLVVGLLLQHSDAFVARRSFQKSNSRSTNLCMSSTGGIAALKRTAASLLAIGTFFLPVGANAIELQYKLPPIDYKDKNRCKLESSSIGQANAARDKLYDLRECDLKGQSGAGKDMSGMIGANADFAGVSFKDAQISK